MSALQGFGDTDATPEIVGSPRFTTQVRAALLLLRGHDVLPTIAHDSFYSKLYHDYLKTHLGALVPDEVWTGTPAEQQCRQHQLAVMQHIGADQWELDYAKTGWTGTTSKPTASGPDERRRQP